MGKIPGGMAARASGRYGTGTRRGAGEEIGTGEAPRSAEKRAARRKATIVHARSSNSRIRKNQSETRDTRETCRRISRVANDIPDHIAPRCTAHARGKR